MKTGVMLLVGITAVCSAWAEDQDMPRPVRNTAPRQYSAPRPAPQQHAQQQAAATQRPSFSQPRQTFAPNYNGGRHFPITNQRPFAGNSSAPRQQQPDMRRVWQGSGRPNVSGDSPTSGGTATVGEQWRNWRNRTGANGGATTDAWRSRGDWRSRANGGADTGRTHGDWRNRVNGGGSYGGLSWAEACRRYNHHRHDRGWWHSRYPRIILIGGGYYYWDAGWWYPAWGYDSYYSNYAYDGPIYGGNNYDVSPEQTIADVQSALQQAGYYFGAVDGQLGPLTRQAIAAWQRDHGLAQTTVIDPPTLRSLGM